MILARETLVLAAVSLGALALALFVTFRPSPEYEPVAGAGEPAFPGLAENADSISEIRIERGEASTTLVLEGNQWTVAERANYPADFRHASALASGIARAVKIAPKSSDPARFSNMGLGEEAIAISLLDQNGNTLVSFEAGRQFSDLAAGGLATYALLPGAERAWTVSGLPLIDPSPAFWIDREVMSLSPARVKRVAVRFGDKGETALSRTRAVDFPFEPAEFKGKAVDQGAVNALAFALSSVIAEDVAKAADLDLFRVAGATFTAFDGLSITVTFFDSDGVVWASFEAAYDPTVLEEPDTPSLLPDVPPDGEGEAAGLNAKWKGWVYRLPVQKVSDVLKREEDLAR